MNNNKLVTAADFSGKKVTMTLLVITGVLIVIMNVTNATITGRTFMNVRMFLLDNNEPYYDKSTNGAIGRNRSLIDDMFLKRIITICGGTVKMDHDPTILSTHQQLLDIITTPDKQELYNKLNYTGLTDEIVVIGTTTLNKEKIINKEFKKYRVLSTKPAIIVKSGDLLLLVKFFDTFSRCLIVVFFSLMVAIVISAIVWTIERITGNHEFKSYPIQGLWTTFWFSVVTMTTVGYGDKAPKHPLSRLVTIIWILFGLMLVGLITAAAWISLDQEYVTKNKDIAVLKGSAERAVCENILHGNAVKFDTNEQVLQAVENDTVRIAVMDQYIAADLIGKRNDDVLVIERLVDMNLKVRIFLLYNETVLGCEESENDDWKEDALTNIMLKHIPPYQITKSYVRPIRKMFDNSDRGLVIYTTITAAGIILLVLISEIILRARKKSNRKFDDIDDDDEGFRKSKKYQEIGELEAQFSEIIARMRKQAANEFKKRKDTR